MLVLVLAPHYVDVGCDVWAVRVFGLMGLTCLGFRPGGFNTGEYVNIRMDVC